MLSSFSTAELAVAAGFVMFGLVLTVGAVVVAVRVIHSSEEDR